MYFEIENTPEHVRRSRREQPTLQESPEEVPRLTLAPFSRTPLITFEDVPIGLSKERTLEVYNPAKYIQQITISCSLPPGLVVDLPGECLVLEPESCYCLSLVWTPKQPTKLRETIRFINENRGRHDVVVVLKTFMGKTQIKGLKISPGKVTKKINKGRKSVGAMCKKSQIMCNPDHLRNSVNMVKTTSENFKLSNKENISVAFDNSMEYLKKYCPFNSPTSIEFNASEIFPSTSNFKVLQETYEKSPDNLVSQSKSHNILKPSNKQLYTSGSDIFDNITFTPLKTIDSKNDKVEHVPKIVFNLNSENDDLYDIELKESMKENIKEWVTGPSHQFDRPFNIETSRNLSKKVPNTSSPKELNSPNPNFSINTELSRISDFLPQKCSTEKKVLFKYNDEPADFDDTVKLSSDTYTKSPSSSVNFIEESPLLYSVRDQAQKYRQSLFQHGNYHNRNYLSARRKENNDSENNFGNEIVQSPLSLTPPLQSIPEESTQISETNFFDKSERQNTFSINRTYNKSFDRSCIKRNSWSKKAVQSEIELWKVPMSLPKKPLKRKSSKSDVSKRTNITFESNDIARTGSLSLVENVYTQSYTLDPFMSTMYIYDEEAVHQFEVEFKKWLNYILTPPSDLDSNDEQKLDLGRAWIENKNKEIPVAPTKEQVCFSYHNSKRLINLRKSARDLLLSPDIKQVLQKLYAQIDKKLLAIRTDKNLHLDVGLQKIIIEILLSYNPLWLRIGIEALYGIVLPLRSNSDVEGITNFIIQKMFKNPYLKNKNSKSNAPNMLLPAYMEAIKKFTLKKFFSLVYLLDQAKERKLIAHDPCLFCRNAVCKESREIIIRFTREVIAGIGDITKHLRPLGYVVSHKQSYLDEYKYAVNNIATEIRDGVRLTKVMEIILMKNGLLKQLRTPAISRLQKIHNVQVALNALKDANFIIIGDITASDIADGHREKTLSLLWQIIHKFRAPLFEKAATVIQAWWKKKYVIISEKRKAEEAVRTKRDNAARIIQYWWKQIQYDRFVEMKMKQLTVAVITIQKYCRRWLCQKRFHLMKRSVLIIEKWYKSVKLIITAKNILNELRQERNALKLRSIIVLQSCVRRWICKIQYNKTIKKIILLQKTIRGYLIRKSFLKIKSAAIFVQQKYKGKLLMRAKVQEFEFIKRKVTIIQSYIRMYKQRKLFLQLKKAVDVIQERYLAVIKMRKDRITFLRLKYYTTLLQAIYRGRKLHLEYNRKRNLIIKMQRKIRANQQMKKIRNNYLTTKNAVITLQNHIRAYQAMKKCKHEYIIKRKSALVIQQYIKSYLLMKSQRLHYHRIHNAAVVIQRRYRSLLIMRDQRNYYIRLKNTVITIQQRFKAIKQMKVCRMNYQKVYSATLVIQLRYKALKQMRQLRQKYLKMKNAAVVIQKLFRAYSVGHKQRLSYLETKRAAIVLQKHFRNRRQGLLVMRQYQLTKQSCLVIQRRYRAYIIGRKQHREFLKLKFATVRIQKYYRSYTEMRMLREQFIQLRSATVCIQRSYRSYLKMKRQRKQYLELKNTVIRVQRYYRMHRETKIIRKHYCDLRNAVLCVQIKYRSILAMRKERSQFYRLRSAVVTIQLRYRALLNMRTARRAFLKLKYAVVLVQKRYRVNRAMRYEKERYIMIRNSCIKLQRFYRAYNAGRKQREYFLRLLKSTVILQQRYRGLLKMRKERALYLKTKTAAITIQRYYRARNLMIQDKLKYLKILQSCIVIQRGYRAYKVGKQLRQQFLIKRTAAILIQRKFRAFRNMKEIRINYLHLRNKVIYIQQRFRVNKLCHELRRRRAVNKIENWFLSIKLRNKNRESFLFVKKSITLIQATFRMYLHHKKYIQMKASCIKIQRFYRSHKLRRREMVKYSQIKISTVFLQAQIRRYLQRKRFMRMKNAALMIQLAFRIRKRIIIRKQYEKDAAICIQKNIRRYLVRAKYLRTLKYIILIQNIWRSKLMTRMMRCDFLQKKRAIIKVQALARGYIARRQIKMERENLLAAREKRRRLRSAIKIQAFYRAYKTRSTITDKRLTELLSRWRNGALKKKSGSCTARECYNTTIHAMKNTTCIEEFINSLRSLKLVTELFPTMYYNDVPCMVNHIYVLMRSCNRSISSVELLEMAVSVLVNLTRHNVMGPKIYSRKLISLLLLFMLRFSKSEPNLFCIMATYIWLLGKYDAVRDDLITFLHTAENYKILMSIKKYVRSVTLMQSAKRSKSEHQPGKRVQEEESNSSFALPRLNPDYGVVYPNQPRYFKQPEQAINNIFSMFEL